MAEVYLVKLPSDECPWTVLMINRYCSFTSLILHDSVRFNDNYINMMQMMPIVGLTIVYLWGTFQMALHRERIIPHVSFTNNPKKKLRTLVVFSMVKVCCGKNIFAMIIIFGVKNIDFGAFDKITLKQPYISWGNDSYPVQHCWVLCLFDVMINQKWKGKWHITVTS